MTFRRHCLILCLALLSATAAGAETLRFAWENPAASLDEAGSWILHSEEAGRPRLPLAVLSYAIPSGHRIAEIRLEGRITARETLGMPLALFGGLEGSEGSRGRVEGAPGEAWPAGNLLVAAASHQRGMSTAEIVLSPWRQEDGGSLSRLERCEILLVTEPDPGARRPLRQRAGSWGRDLEQLAARVENPADLRAFVSRPRFEEPEGPFEPRGVPSLEGSGVDMVIVTTAELAATFQVLADYKTRTGIPAVVRDLDWVQAHYPQGADLPETLRRFVQDAYERWGIRYLILGGDTQQVPVRYARSVFTYPPASIPSDLYYAALDGNWNADGDEYFGEAASGGIGGDDVDMSADLHVGRLPAQTVEDATLLIDKIITYSESPDLTYCNKMTLLGEVLFPATWHIGDPEEEIDRNGADYCEEIFNDYTPGTIDVRRLYETYWLYPGSEPELLDTVIEDMNTRSHLVHHVGHGFRYNMSVGEGNFMVVDAQALANGLDHLIALYTMNCTSCAIDYACLGETFLLAENGGSILTIGSVREAFPQTAVYYENNYYESVFADSCSAGESFTYSHNRYSHLAQLEGSHRWTQFAYVYLGDPSVELWLWSPEALELALDEPFELHSDTLRVTLSSGGNPVENAIVVAMKDGEDRAQGRTLADGSLALPFQADSPGDILIHARANNLLPVDSTLAVAAGTEARLSIASLTVVDDHAAADSIAGNADGRADAGERIQLDLQLVNSGGGPATLDSLVLGNPGGELLVHEGVLPLGGTVLDPGTPLDLSLCFDLELEVQEIQDRGRVLLEVEIHTADRGLQRDRVDLITYKPIPRLFSFRVDDSATGDGDGQPDAGETYDWVPTWKNYGATPLEGWSAEMVALDPEGHVLSGPVDLPMLGLLEMAEGDPIQLLEDDVSVAHEFLLMLNCSRWIESAECTVVKMRRPMPPDELVLDSSVAPTIIDMTWEEPDTNAAGYLIYRGEQSGGPYELVSSEPTAYTYFRNTDLSESSEYFFRAETVDEFGYRSAPSGEFAASTNPVMLSGWPAETLQGTASSIVIGDIDGDGDKEVVAGSNWIHAWHHDGSEVLDGDNDSGTYGVLTPAGERYTASLAMAQIDTSTVGLEIVGCSRETYEVFVFHGDGTVMSGWPKTLPYWVWATPAVADVDGDGLMEIFVTCLNGVVYAWNHDGSSFIDGAGGVFVSGVGSWSKSSPCLGNLDADPELEIVQATEWGVVHVWNHDASYLPGWPKAVGEAVNSSPSLGDLDGDGTLEIVCHTDADELFAWNADGTLFAPRFPIELESNAGGLAPSPALVDFEGDGQMEIVAVGVGGYTHMDVLVIRNNGLTVDGWPVHVQDSSEASPVVVDLDGDQELEILLGTEAGYLYGWEQDGTPLPGFPILTEAEVRSSPTIDDLDDNFTVEVALLGWDSYVYIWDMPAFYYNGLAQWKMFRANPARTGVFTRETQISTDLPVDLPPVADGRLWPNWPNPFNPKTSIRFQMPAGSGRVAVELAVFDLRGRRVATLFQGELPAGSIQSFEWTGADDRGAPVASGVYFARLASSEGQQTRKMMLLK